MYELFLTKIPVEGFLFARMLGGHREIRSRVTKYVSLTNNRSRPAFSNSLRS